jgi:hypothetical protein
MGGCLGQVRLDENRFIKINKRLFFCQRNFAIDIERVNIENNFNYVNATYLLKPMDNDISITLNADFKQDFINNTLKVISTKLQN